MGKQLSIIVAASNNRVIGINNKLPWNIPTDLKYFKEKTSGHIVICGRKTYESIGKPLPNRTNIVISSNPSYKAPGCIVVNSLQSAINLCEDSKEAFIIGGAQLYKEALKIADTIYYTVVDANIDGDAFFPILEGCWVRDSITTPYQSPKDQYPISFAIYKRCKF